MKLFQEVLFCCVISGCHKIRFYLRNCSSQWDCCFIWVCRPSMEQQNFGWMGVGIDVSQCLCDYRLPVLLHRGVWFGLGGCFFSSNRVNCTVQYTYPAAVHIGTFQRQRTFSWTCCLHCALSCVCIASDFDYQWLLAAGLGYVIFSSSGCYSNTVLFIFQI